MTYQDALRQIPRGALSPVYLLHGDEPFFILELLTLLRGRNDPGPFNNDLFDGDTADPARIVMIAKTGPMLGTHRLIIVRNADRIKDDRGLLLAYLKSPYKTTTLVLTAQKPDMRKSFFITLKGVATVIVCAPLPERAMADWITREGKKRGIRFTPDALTFLQMHLGRDLFRIQQEMDKLSLYLSSTSDPIPRDVVAQGVAHGKSGSVFDLIDAIGEKDGPDAIRRLTEMLRFGDPPLLILALLARQWRIMTLVKAALQAGCSPPEATSKAGVPPFRSAPLLKQVSHWNMEEIRHAFDLMLSADSQLKADRLSAATVLNILVLDLCGSARIGYRAVLS